MSSRKIVGGGITGLSLTVFLTPRRGTKTRVIMEPSSDLSPMAGRKEKGEGGIEERIELKKKEEKSR